MNTPKFCCEHVWFVGYKLTFCRTWRLNTFRLTLSPLTVIFEDRGFWILFVKSMASDLAPWMRTFHCSYHRSSTGRCYRMWEAQYVMTEVEEINVTSSAWSAVVTLGCVEKPSVKTLERIWDSTDPWGTPARPRLWRRESLHTLTRNSLSERKYQPGKLDTYCGLAWRLISHVGSLPYFKQEHGRKLTPI